MLVCIIAGMSMAIDDNAAVDCDFERTVRALSNCCAFIDLISRSFGIGDLLVDYLCKLYSEILDTPHIIDL